MTSLPLELQDLLPFRKVEREDKASCKVGIRALEMNDRRGFENVRFFPKSICGPTASCC